MSAENHIEVARKRRCAALAYLANATLRNARRYDRPQLPLFETKYFPSGHEVVNGIFEQDLRLATAA